MTPENVDRAITKALELCGGQWPNEEYAEVVGHITRYAKGEGTDDSGHWLAFRLGGCVRIEERHIEADQILMHLINLRSPNASPPAKEAARVIYPSTWDWLSDA